MQEPLAPALLSNPCAFCHAGWEILPVEPKLLLGGSHNLCNQPTLAGKGLFPPVYVISARGCSSCADGVLLPACSGQGEHLPRPSPPGRQPDGMGWSQNPSSTSPANQQVFGVVK